MEAGQKVALWLHDDAAKLFLGLMDRRPVSRWVVIGTVEGLSEAPPGVWVDIKLIEERRPQRGRKDKRVHYTVTPPRCLIRLEYLITVQKDAENPEKVRIGFL